MEQVEKQKQLIDVLEVSMKMSNVISDDEGF